MNQSIQQASTYAPALASTITIVLSLLFCFATIWIMERLASSNDDVHVKRVSVYVIISALIFCAAIVLFNIKPIVIHFVIW